MAIPPYAFCDMAMYCEKGGYFMTFVQIQYILEIAQSGSISGAARKLFTTQSNLSTLIKNAEQEAGITIFNRTQNGVTPTPEGARFLQLAQESFHAYSEMMNLSQPQNGYQFTLCCIKFTAFDDAFLELLRRYQDYPEYKFALIRNPLRSIRLKQAQNRTDALAVALVTPSERNSFLEQLDEMKLIGVPMGQLPVNVYLCKEHPVLQSWDREEDFPFARLWEYPFVDYNDGGMRKLTLQATYPYLPKHPKRVISLPDISLKTEFIRTGNAFSFGVSRPFLTMEENGLTTIPIPNCYMHVYCCYSSRQPASPIMMEYLDLVREELERRDIQRDNTM